MAGMPRWWILTIALVFWLLALPPRPAAAIPLFAHQYRLRCQTCHTVVPQLTQFGEFFRANGYRIPGIAPSAAMPIAMRVNLVDSSQNQGAGPDGAGLPKAIVDELELFTAGRIGSRANYFVEQYVIDGGEPGLLRDAWIADRITPWTARMALGVQGGQFTLPLPVDPETFRQTYEHYALFDQTVGNNPFNFFDPKIGAMASLGSPLYGTQFQLFAGPGHDRQSGLPTIGTDLMAYVQQIAGPLTLSAYRYQGQRPDEGWTDRFERDGYGIVFSQGRWTSQSVIQTGWDSSCLPNRGCSSSGGFTQLRYDIGPSLYALARYEGTSDSIAGVSRDGVVLLGLRPARNSSFTIEDVIGHVPQTQHTMNAQLTVAY